MDINPVENQSWRAKSACADPKWADVDFFAQDKLTKNLAKNICFTCPVRDMCLKYALDTETIDGIWGGAEEADIRRTLSLDAEHKEVRRNRYPQCLNCGARTSKLFVKIIDLPNGGRWTTAKAVECSVCGFDWKSRPSANAVTAYHTERANVEAKRLKKALDVVTNELIQARTADQIDTAVEKTAQEVYEDALESRVPDEESDLNRKIWMEARRLARLSAAKLDRLEKRTAELRKEASDALARAKSGPTSAKPARPDNAELVSSRT